MTDRDDMVLRIEAAMERYERERMKPKHLNYWSRIKHCGVRFPAAQTGEGEAAEGVGCG